ncbi:MAG: hydrogenase maturation protease [Actinomycetota bacterium]
MVIGIGNAMRGDDGIGPTVIEALRHRLERDDVELLIGSGESTALIEAWTGRSLAVVIDAVQANTEPGTVHRADFDLVASSGWHAGASSHGAGLAEAVALSEVLDRRPARLLVLGVEWGGLEHGRGLSGSVAAAIPALVELIEHELDSSVAAPRVGEA